MNAVVLSALLAASGAGDELSRVLRDRFERAGRTAPTPDPALTRAAQSLAQVALESGPQRASGLAAVTLAISAHGAWDADPTTVVVRASKGELLEALNGQADLTVEPASVVGLGVAENETMGAVFVLLARRKVNLAPVPRALERGAKAQRLCGQLVAPLSSGEWFVTRPDGAVDRYPLSTQGDGLCATVPFAAEGRHAVELLARGPRGPEVAALFFVAVGKTPDPAQLEPDLEAATDAEARAQISARINALRGSMGQAPLKPDPALQEIAQRYAERLGRENFFSHVAPDGSALPQRLVEAHYAYASAGENLGLAAGPLAAHFGIEHSPGHRKNLLDADHTVLGLGITRQPSGQTVLVELLARPADRQPEEPIEAAWSALARARQDRKLPPLHRSPPLDALAQEHAREALAQQLPKTVLPGRKRPHDRVFEVLEDAASVAVDVFVAQSVTAVTESKNLIDPGNTTAGVGIVRGDSEKFGPDRFWIIVIYAAVKH